MMDLLLKHGRIIDPANKVDMFGDLLIVDGKIDTISDNIEYPSAKVIDVSNQIVSPGFVEMHAHMRDFNEPERETFYTGSCCAACGGYTSVGVMPNSNPVIDTPEMVWEFKRREMESSIIRLYPFSAVTKGRNGREIVDMKEMKKSGVVAFSDDGNAIKEATMMRDILLQTKEVDLVVDLHCEDKAYSGDGVVNAGDLAKEMGLPGISSVAEDVEIARDLIIQEEIQGHMHIAHLGSERSIALVKLFRQRGVDFSCEVIPHQFSRTEEIVKKQGVRAKVKPPFRSQKDVDGIRNGLKEHLIDVIASDHCPYTDEEIAGGITATKLFGLAGFETTLPLSLELVRSGYIDYSYLISCLTCNPAKIMRLKDRGTLSIGCSADVTVFDPHLEWIVDLSQMKTKASNNPYGGEKMTGKVTLTIVGGEIVQKNGVILKKVAKAY